MIRKSISPILFLMFSLLLIIIETSITLPVDSDGISHNGVNLFNRLLLFLVVLAIITFEIFPYSKKMNNKIQKFSYILLSSGALILISIFWIITFTFK
jgi:hypothetical protein